jgi:hypothetical protein
MHQKAWDGRNWSPWKTFIVEILGPIGGGPGSLTSQPGCVSWAPNRIDCFVVSSRGAMLRKVWDGQTWLHWENLGSPPGVTITLNSEPTCVSWEPNRIDCFVLGSDNAMHSKAWDGQNWSGWANLGGILNTSPSCVSWGPNRIDCFVLGTDNAMYHKAWDGQQWRP